MAKRKKALLYPGQVDKILEDYDIQIIYSAGGQADEIYNRIIELIEDEKAEKEISTLENEDLTEPINTFFALNVFKDCETLEDFKQKYAELQIRSFNFYKPLGLKDKKGNQIKI